MSYIIKPTSRFQKDLKRIQKRGYDLTLLTDVIKKLANGELLLYLTRTGTHSDLF